MLDETQIPLLPETSDILRSRAHWQYTGRSRPTFATNPGQGQESVWDYPRPPILVDVAETVRVLHGHTLIAETQSAKRVLETAGAPTIYLPPADVNMDLLEFGALTSICEWKGLAQTITVVGVADAGWRYVQMFPEFTDIYQWPSFYPGKLDCFMGAEHVRPQPGGYYGGWVTENITGPIKGDPGSQGW